MMTSTARAIDAFNERSGAILSQLKETGQLKILQMIESPMDATVRLRGYGEVACFCSNNYLGLANHAEVVGAGLACPGDSARVRRRQEQDRADREQVDRHADFSFTRPPTVAS